MRPERLIEKVCLSLYLPNGSMWLTEVVRRLGEQRMAGKQTKENLTVSSAAARKPKALMLP
jgi:hypothetical protein